MTICLDCKKEYDKKHNKCPIFGSLNREIHVSDNIHVDDFGCEINSKEKHHGKPNKQYFSRYETYKKTGEKVKKERNIDYDNNKYYEKVETLDGKIIHYCEERLTDHINHGSAKGISYIKTNKN